MFLRVASSLHVLLSAESGVGKTLNEPLAPCSYSQPPMRRIVEGTAERSCRSPTTTPKAQDGDAEPKGNAVVLSRGGIKMHVRAGPACHDCQKRRFASDLTVDSIKWLLLIKKDEKNSYVPRREGRALYFVEFEFESLPHMPLPRTSSILEVSCQSDSHHPRRCIQRIAIHP